MAANGPHNYSAAKSPNQSVYRNNNGGRDFSEQHEMSYGHSRHRMANRGGPGPRSQNCSLESKERSHMTGDDQILRNNEMLLLSAKKEN